MIITHCDPTGAGPAAHQLGVPGVPGLGSVQVPATVDGIAVMLHGLFTATPTIPITPADTGGILPNYFGTWAADLLADNWVVLEPSHPEDGWAAGPPLGGLWDDVSNDATFGARYLNTVLLWWDHIIGYCGQRWPGKKIALFGFSMGGWMGFQIAANRQSTVLGGVVHCPATIWSNANPAFTPPDNFGTLTTTGMDAGATILNSCTKPLMVSYGTADAAVGYDAAGTGGTPVSNTDAIITNAVAAGRPITRNATTDNHELLSADVTTFMSYVTGTLDPLR